MASPLAGFYESTFTHDGLTRPMFSAGSGPGVIVIHEVPGITPEVAAFARRVVERGYSVRMPSLLGTPGKSVSVGYVIRSMVKGYVAKEFAKFALDRTGPIIGW